jgi:hypothetical protein
MSDDPGKKKIIVDEDWKSRVDAEREELEQQQRGQSTEPQASEDRRMPPASFEMLLTTLATEAMICLGQIPHPVTGKQEVAKDQARYFIDTLAMLQEKTSGNLTADEEKAISGLLHQLRSVFVSGESPIVTPGDTPPAPPPS